MSSSRIRGEQIKDETIESDDIASGSIKAGEMSEQAIRGQALITSTNIKDDKLLIWDATDTSLKEVALENLFGEISAVGTDANFFVSGAIGSQGQSSTNGTAVFGGDLAVSGNVRASGKIYVADNAGIYTDKIRRFSDSDNTTKILLNEDHIKLYAGSNSIAIVRIGDTNKGTDSNFWVSGSIGSRNTSTRGTAIFNGDVFSSGTFYGFSGMRIDTLTELHALNIDPLSDTVSFFKEDTPGVDSNWFVSGSIGGTINHACFGGDLIVSGGLAVDGSTLVIDEAKSLVGIGTASPRVKLDVTHDPTSLSDDTGGGEVVTFGGEDGTDALAAGKLMFLHSGGDWKYADADAVATSGGVLLAIALGNAVTDGLLIRGFFDAATIEGSFVKGAACYISEVAGTIDFTAPSGVDDVVRVVGYGTDTANVIYFNPSSTWIELA